MKRLLCHRLALAAALVAGACGSRHEAAPAAPDLGPPVVHEDVAADVIEMIATESKAVRMLMQDPKAPLAASPFQLNKDDVLGSDKVHHVLRARAESAFEVRLPTLPAGSRLVAQTCVYSPFYFDPARADPEPVTFRILVNGVERASLASDYVTRPEGRKNPYDILLRTLNVKLDEAAGQPVTLRFETTRGGRVVPTEAAQAEPLWWDLQVLQPIAVPREAATTRAPNLLLLVVDTLALGHTSLAGGPRDTTPNLRQLAAHGVCFTRAISASSWTMPATASLLTGLPPNTHGVLGDERSYLMSGLRTVAEALREQGIETAAFSANVLLAPITGFDQGFGHFERVGSELIGSSADEEHSKAPAAEMNERLLAWLDTQPKGARWFAWVQYMDPHAPYAAPGDARLKYARDYVERRDFSNFLPSQVRLPPEQFKPLELDEKRHLADLYDAELAYFDEQLGHLLGELNQKFPNTLIVLTADHGEEFFEHGQPGHGQSLYDELLHVPLVFSGPPLPSSVRCEVPVSTAGVAATLLSAGGALTGGLEPSVLTALDAPGGPVFSTVRTSLFDPLAHVLVSGEDADGRKVILVDDEKGTELKVLRFNLKQDPHEGAALDPTTLTPDERARFEALQKAAREWARRTAADCPPGPQPYSSQIQTALQQIGYTGSATKAANGVKQPPGDDQTKQDGAAKKKDEEKPPR